MAAPQRNHRDTTKEIFHLQHPRRKQRVQKEVLEHLEYLVKKKKVNIVRVGRQNAGLEPGSILLAGRSRCRLLY